MPWAPRSTSSFAARVSVLRAASRSPDFTNRMPAVVGLSAPRSVRSISSYPWSASRSYTPDRAVPSVDINPIRRTSPARARTCSATASTMGRMGASVARCIWSDQKCAELHGIAMAPTPALDKNSMPWSSAGSGSGPSATIASDRSGVAGSEYTNVAMCSWSRAAGVLAASLSRKSAVAAGPIPPSTPRTGPAVVGITLLDIRSHRFFDDDWRRLVTELCSHPSFGIEGAHPWICEQGLVRLQHVDTCVDVRLQHERAVRTDDDVPSDVLHEGEHAGRVQDELARLAPVRQLHPSDLRAGVRVRSEPLLDVAVREPGGLRQLTGVQVDPRTQAASAPVVGRC